MCLSKASLPFVIERRSSPFESAADNLSETGKNQFFCTELTRRSVIDTDVLEGHPARLTWIFTLSLGERESAGSGNGGFIICITRSSNNWDGAYFQFTSLLIKGTQLPDRWDCYLCRGMSHLQLIARKSSSFCFFAEFERFLIVSWFILLLI